MMLKLEISSEELNALRGLYKYVTRLGGIPYLSTLNSVICRAENYLADLRIYDLVYTRPGHNDGTHHMHLKATSVHDAMGQWAEEEISGCVISVTPVL